MKLKAHRNDVKWLIEHGKQGYGTADYIARRYLNLIRIAEHQLEMDDAWKSRVQLGNEKRVLKDAEV